MKTTTTWIAGCWCVIAAYAVLSSVLKSPLMMAEYSWTETCFAGGLSVVSVVGAIDLLRREALGWWISTGANGLLAALCGWGIARTCGVYKGIESVSDLLASAIMVFLTLCFVALVLDRPSKWCDSGS